MTSLKKIIDLQGEIFNGIEVLRFVERDRKKRATIWKCQCHCGNIFNTYSNNLKSGNTKSCGCRAGGVGISKNFKFNEWKFNDGVAIGITHDKREFIIDKSSYEVSKDYCWRVHSDGYIVANNKVDNNVIKIHRLLTNFDIVDHKDGNKLNNRLSNLRQATHSQNNVNIKLRSDNTSGYTGVKESKSGKWKSQISFNGKRIHIGTYSKFEDAVYARAIKEIEIHGKFNGEKNRNSLENLLEIGKISKDIYLKIKEMDGE